MQNNIKGKGAAIALFTLIITYTLITRHSHQQTINRYRDCIHAQSQTQGYILRHQCSPLYQQLDKEANLEYIQKGYDLYLK